MFLNYTMLLGRPIMQNQIRMFGKRTTYACIPTWQKEVKRDPFDYPLRSKEEVMHEFKYFAPTIELKANYKRYLAGDTRENNPENLDNRERVSKIFVDIRKLQLAPLQRQRFQYLLGPRFDKTRPHACKIVMSQYNTFHENYVRAMETLREIYWEAKRAPSINTTMIQNPYRREFLMKKMLGKTREERVRNRAMLKNVAKKHIKAVDQAEVEQELGLVKTNAKTAIKRREFGALRAKLGFKDKSEEVDDPILSQLEFDESNYQKSLKEQRERKPVKIVSDIHGIGKNEIYEQMLRSDEHFK